ncbi:MAG: hypothetical protein IJ617_00540 [Oscillospiraceae bacterium]|nr:hypothetical protein [Oscillospiraceae bacterium]
MMRIDQVNVFGKKLWLLHTGEEEVGSDRKTCEVWYNYFENDCWECAVFEWDSNSASIGSGKVGGLHFARVLYAAQVLREFYVKGFGMALYNGCIVDARELTGWLNHLFDEQYTNARVWDIWKTALLLRKFDCEIDGWISEYRFFPSWVEESSYSLSSSLNFFAAYSPEIVRAFVLEDGARAYGCQDENGKFKTVETLTRARHILTEMEEAAEDSREETIERLKNMLKSGSASQEELHSEQKTLYKELAFYQGIIPRNVLIRFMADQFGLDFWALYDEVSAFAPGDEPIDSRVFDGNKKPRPIRKVSTETFLNVTGDDRAYWWREGGGNVRLSPAMYARLAAWQLEIDDIAAQGLAFADGNRFLEALADTLDGVRKLDRFLFAFRDTFYDLQMHWKDARRQALVVLLRRLSERCRKNRKTDETGKEEGADNASDTDGTGNPDEIKWLRRYLAVLGNMELRKKALGV